jgi:hypothetical protein
LDKNEGSHGEYLEEWREVEIHGEIPPIQWDLRGRRVEGERDTGGGAQTRGGRSGVVKEIACGWPSLLKCQDHGAMA